MGTKFYLPCPVCQLPIRGSMSGVELEDHKISLECEIVREIDVSESGLSVVTINPFVPSKYESDSHDLVGAMPTMTLTQVLGFERFLAFETERHASLDAGRSMWPQVRMLFQYYLQGNVEMFTRIAEQHFGIDWKPETAHQRSSIAYQALGMVTTTICGETGSTSERILRRFLQKHRAAMKSGKVYLSTIRERGKSAAELERNLFTELNRFVERQEAWEMGLLMRFMEPGAQEVFDELVLFRDEFSVMRDLYQQGFELACKCLWPLVAAQNSVKRGDPNDFGDVHPGTDLVPENKRPSNLKKFDSLSSAYKVAYVSQVPGWEALAEVLNNTHRNTIGHATAHHDLHTGRVVSDKDPEGMTYLSFLGHSFAVFDVLSTLAQALRAVRGAASPDFGLDD